MNIDTNATNSTYPILLGAIRMEAAIGIGSGVGGCLFFACVYTFAVWCNNKRVARAELHLKGLDFDV
jgi:hypothetical protein